MSEPDVDILIEAEFEFLEAAPGELDHLWQTRPCRAADIDSSMPRFRALIQRAGWRMVDPSGPPRILHPSLRWRFDPVHRRYVMPAPDDR
jgi:hypothetical protein